MTACHSVFASSKRSKSSRSAHATIPDRGVLRLRRGGEIKPEGDMEKTIIEINGVKLEVDMRYARRVEEMRIGDRVKVLSKSYGGHEVNPGIVVGFEPFAKLPTIVVAVAKVDWNKSEINFVHYNAESKDVEIVVAADPDFELDRERIIKGFDKQIASKHREIQEIEERKRYFETNFRAYWQSVAKPEPQSETAE
jgi:hypothetical protein